MKISVGTAVLVIAACLSCRSSVAQNVSDTSKLWVTMAEGTVPGRSSFHLRSEGGPIRVEGTSDRNITYVVSATASSAKGVRQPSNTFLPSGDTPWRSRCLAHCNQNARFSEDFRSIPRSCSSSVKSLELEASSGAVEIGNLSCRVRIHSKGGSIELADADGPVFAETSAQDINIGRVGGDGWFHTGAGRISVNHVKGRVDAWTGAGSISVNTGLQDALLRAGAGDITIANCGGRLTVVSGGGNLLLGDLAGPADIQTNGGNVRVHSARGSSVRGSRSKTRPCARMLETLRCIFLPIWRSRFRPAWIWGATTE